jgi:serine/threonine-protein kinase
MGVIYRAERLRLGRPVAIKILQAALAMEKKFIGRFEQEARALSRLSHPHCVSIIDFGVADAPYLVMDFVHGRSLKELLMRGGLPAPRALHIFRQVLAALAHAHGHGIIHRDIKPGNIMLTEATGTGDFIRILDFGLAKIHNAALAVVATGSAKVVGTPAYMSPEQAAGRPVDARSDLYSAGAVFYELLSGQKPFWSEDTFELLRMHREDSAPPLRQADPSTKVSAELESVVHRALAKEPKKRFQSALAFSEALDGTPEATMPLLRFYGVRPVPTGETSASPSAPPSVLTPKPQRGWLWLLVLLLLVLVGGGVWYYRFGRYIWDMDKRPGKEVPIQVVGPPDAASSALTADDLSVSDSGATPVDALSSLETPRDSSPIEDADTSLPPDGPVSSEPARPPPSGRSVRNLRDVKALLDAGQREEALVGLRVLRRRSPRNAYVPYLMGTLYFDKRWWSEGMKAYAASIRNNPAYRRKRRIIKDLIDALGGRRTEAEAARMLQKTGRASLHYLRAAAKKHHSARVRQRAASLARRIGGQ